MIDALADNLDAIRTLYREFGVVRLEVFGSAARGVDFGASSDVDILVEFAPDTDFGPWLSYFFAFKQRLEAILGRKVDLVTQGSFRNPYLIRSVEQDRHLVYAAYGSATT